MMTVKFSRSVRIDPIDGRAVPESASAAELGRLRFRRGVARAGPVTGDHGRAAPRPDCQPPPATTTPGTQTGTLRVFENLASARGSRSERSAVAVTKATDAQRHAVKPRHW